MRWHGTRYRVGVEVKSDRASHQAKPEHILTSLDKESKHDAETGSKRFHPDRADDRRCDHRYSGRRGHPGVPGLHDPRSRVGRSGAGCPCQAERGGDCFVGSK